MKSFPFRALVFLLVSLWLGAPALASIPPPTGRSLTEALNPDGTLRPGANGSFDARQFRMGTAPDGRPVFRPTGTVGTGDERWADGFGLPNGASGEVKVVVRAGADIYIGGTFEVVGSVTANCVAKWNGTTWSSLGTGTANGVNGFVAALAVAGNGDVYVGGYFTRAGGVSANNVAKWNGTAWSRMGAGTAGASSGVVALAVASNGDVYAGGEFTQAGGAANYVAKWNGTAWSSLGTGTANGTSYFVNALAIAGNGDVYVGGNFTQAGGAAANYVARWNGTAWSNLGSGMDYIVNAVAVASNGDVYAGGVFTQAGGVAANHVAKWNGTAWSNLRSGVSYTVNTLAVASNGEVYAGGAFSAGLVSPVAKWNGTTWNNLGTSAANALDNDVDALAVASNGDLYASGRFTQAGGASANGVAKWNGTAWSSVGPSAANGVNGLVTALAVAGNGDVYIGGNFTQAGGAMANGVAKWNGTTWSSLGTGAANGVNREVYALAVAGNGDVYVGGTFTEAGGVSAYSIAKWNGTAWSSLGTGMFGSVRALAVASNGNVYAGGQFSQADNVLAYSVAKWNGTTWSSLGTGAANGLRSGTAFALAVAGNGDVYVGGAFSQAGGVAANNVAKWDGTVWSSLGTGTANGVNYGVINALTVAGNGNIYVGGDFSQAGGVLAHSIAKWDGTIWSSLGANVANGVIGNVNALAAASNGDVYAGGQFSQTGRIAVDYVSKWNGTAWNTLGTGTNGIVNKLALEPTGKLYVGGAFITTGDGSKVMARFAIYDPAAPLATAAAKAAPAAQLYPNPAHGTATLRLPAGAPRLPLTLTDALGRVVRRYPAPAAEAELDLRGLPAGTYVVRCGDVSQRLVVE